MDHYSMEDLLRIMELLRAPEGCPWDREQTHQSIRRNMLEEAYEVAEAIDNRDTANLKEELGDVLLQVVFHSRMAQEEGLFTFDDVVDGICKKLVFRHPHVFGTVEAGDADGRVDEDSRLALRVHRCMREIRRQAGIVFPTDRDKGEPRRRPEGLPPEGRKI